ncbi:hypothetical protein BDV38DRAFT_274710 [Aspergillus pseudotamarii]|uniref:Uncharacterized protein n=1 Tax=Aspergillus pseudotamarii TaxID=132259 RepID=A0A5N6SE58_ASPPS|nr:uncharacterized protein BDV38DRAFT_274710 [Aspergillus pseudotamarii]KAE8132905.1 hypothetical protein BDV38DRAFT_274710 [Aspergillus pseudotamarii]
MATTLEEFAQLETLWDKAIQSPADISLEEKHQMLEWPPPCVEDLFYKAVTDPHSLTYAECRLIKDDFHVIGIMDQLKYANDRRKWIRARPDLQAKREQARTAVLSTIESQAYQNLDDVFYSIQMAHYDVVEERRRHERPSHLPKEWIQNIIDQGEDKSWGYIWYHYREQELWAEFQHQFEDILTTQMFTVVGWDEIEDFKVAEFVEFEAKGSKEQYRGELKPGILSNVFFLVTDEARVSYSQSRQHSFAWAINPDWSRPGADEDGYDGRLKISATQIYFRFYEFMSTKKFTLKDIWRNFHQVNETQTYLPGPLPAWHFTNLDKPVWPDR